MRGVFGLVLAFVFSACQQSGPDMAVVLADKPAAFLADYGLFTDGAADKPHIRVAAYDLVNPLFTDYATKHRYVFVPKGTTVKYTGAKYTGAKYTGGADLDFPVGTVLVKTFAYAPDMRQPDVEPYKIETRLLIRKAQGWTAAPYVWNKEQTQARYAPVGARMGIKAIAADGSKLDFSYAVPNANQCKTCHQSGHDIIPIGPTADNLNHKNQLQRWAQQGLLSLGDLDLSDRSPIAPVGDRNYSLNDRARAYLDINCAHCHKPDGSASNSGLMLQWGETNQVRLGINKNPTAAGRGAGGLRKVITPGNPDTSIMAFRMHSTQAGIAMPELGKTLEHKQGVTLIRDWIATMPPE